MRIAPTKLRLGSENFNKDRGRSNKLELMDKFVKHVETLRMNIIQLSAVQDMMYKIRKKYYPGLSINIQACTNL